MLAAAAPTPLDGKINVVRRLLLGALEVGACDIVYLEDPMRIVGKASSSLMKRLTMTSTATPREHAEVDTVLAARRMAELGCSVVIVLGGDGTNRAVAKGWPDAPVIPISTGTNNAFPYDAEATVAGVAAGLIATGVVDIDEVATPSKVVRVQVDGQPDDVALIDAVVLHDPFVGSMELFNPNTMELAVLSRADPAAVGFSAVGGLLCPHTAEDGGGVLVRFVPPAEAAAPATLLRAPTAPGHYAQLAITETRVVADGESVSFDGPCILAFDGERRRRVLQGVSGSFTVERTGPRVVDLAETMSAAADQGYFTRPAP